ncbi:MAG: zinc ABC transporter substrate-binding protein [Bdellovibrionales bacterium]|nr:zinc ABC transporter substrate-binding protein [Bdellovibrionales bacterium]
MITFNFLVFVLFLSLGFSAELVEAHTKPNSRVVLCSTSLFADLVSTICDSDCEALSLVPQGLDPHLFELRPNALRNLPTPILVVYNGGGFEPWLDSLLSTKFKMIPQLKLLSQLQLTLKPQADFSTEIDPHAWLSPQNGARYYQSIAEKLGELFPEKKVLFKNRAQQIQLALSARAGHWRKEFSEFKSKKILTSHDAFQYFAKDFGLEIVSAQGWSTNSEIKPKSLALLIGRIKAEKIRVLFLETSANSKIIEQIARSTGAVIGGTLNPDNLTPKVSSYLNLIDTNAEIIFTALKKAQEAGGSGL